MVVNYKTLKKVAFPVYVLPSDNWESVDGLLFVDGELVDDKNMPGKTLGIRRLQTPYREKMPLRKTAKDPLAVFKSRKNTFIDNLGRPFIYERTLWGKVKYHRIRKIDRKVVASVLYLEGLRSPFTIPRPPSAEYQWAGVLYIHGLPWMLYEYSTEKLKDTRRKI